MRDAVDVKQDAVEPFDAGDPWHRPGYVLPESEGNDVTRRSLISAMEDVSMLKSGKA